MYGERDININIGKARQVGQVGAAWKTCGELSTAATAFHEELELHNNAR